MSQHIHLEAHRQEPMIDPDTGGTIILFPDAFGQEGHPFIVQVTDPPNATRPRHSHHADVTYVYTAGEHHIDGEGVYRAGDVRWVRQGHAYGPETTGPDGATWWIITTANPTPIDKTLQSEKSSGPSESQEVASGRIIHRPASTATSELVELTINVGAVIVEAAFNSGAILEINAELDAWFAANPLSGQPNSGSKTYDMFLGAGTLRLQALTEKLPIWGPRLVADTRLVEWADGCLAQTSAGALLNAGEFIQIGPGEPAQYLHRDTDSWPDLQRGAQPFLINAIIALDDFTATNGATHVTPGSYDWPFGKQPTLEEQARATMKPGDVLLFRGDLLHGGGSNSTGTRRRGLSLSYCAGWMRTVEAHHRNISSARLEAFPPLLRRLLGDTVHDATHRGGGILGLVDSGR